LGTTAKETIYFAKKLRAYERRGRFATTYSVQSLCPLQPIQRHNKYNVQTVIVPVVLYGCETWSHIKGRT